MPNPAIAAFWDNLDPSSGGTVYYQSDSARLVVSWVGVPRYGTTDYETFQVILTPDGQVLLQYQTLNGSLDTCTVGVQADSTGPSSQVIYNASYLANNLAILFSTADDG